MIDEAKAAFSDIPRIIQHVETVSADLVENVAMFVVKGEDGESETEDLRPGSPFDRYEVNVLVTQDGHDGGCSIVAEPHPTLGNLIGRIEYVSLHGVLVTNFRLIKAGAIVLSRGNVEDQAASKIAATRRVPVLLIRRPRPADDEAIT